MSRTKVYVPRETSAVSVGADDVAIAIARKSKEIGSDIQLVRNGSWGASWLEPLIEVEVDGQRIAYGNVDTGDIDSLFEADFLAGGDHERRLGPIQEIPYLINQDRWTFFRVGLIEPLSIDSYTAHQGFKGLQKAFEIGSEGVLEAVREDAELDAGNGSENQDERELWTEDRSKWVAHQRVAAPGVLV